MWFILHTGEHRSRLCNCDSLQSSTIRGRGGAQLPRPPPFTTWAWGRSAVVVEGAGQPPFTTWAWGRSAVVVEGAGQPPFTTWAWGRSAVVVEGAGQPARPPTVETRPPGS